MTPADRDAAVALATKLLALAERATPGPWKACPDERDDTVPEPDRMLLVCCGQGDEHAGPVCQDPLTDDDARYIAAAHPQAIIALARAVLALAERPTCETCRWWADGHLTDGMFGQCQNDGCPCETRSTHRTFYCEQHEPTPLPSCSICRRDDCGGDHPCE